tara:strand:- start:298 stop:465 length:168 start_codon:yes stop_codon:yes gene_type:complete
MMEQGLRASTSYNVCKGKLLRIYQKARENYQIKQEYYSKEVSKLELLFTFVEKQL